MRQPYLALLFFACLGAGTARADLVFSIDNPNLFGPPGATVGWDFSVTSAPVQVGLTMITPWAVITDAEFDLDPGVFPVGVFTGFINQPPPGAPCSPPSPPLNVIGPDTGCGEMNPWSQTFDNTLQTGTGSYVIDTFQIPGNGATGEIALTYDEYSVSPFDPSFDSTMDTLATGMTVSVPVSVTVTATPEPASAVPAGMVVGLLLLRRRSTFRPGHRSLEGLANLRRVW
jgi:hypothetical protein